MKHKVAILVLLMSMSSQASWAVSISVGSFGTFYSGVDATFDPIPPASPPALNSTDSHAARQSWLGAFSGSPTVTTQNFDSGFGYGSVASGAVLPQTVAGFTYSVSVFTADQTGVFRAGGANTEPLGPHSTRGFNVAEGFYTDASTGYFQVKTNSTASNDGGLMVDFGGSGVTSFGFYLTGREQTKQDVNLVIEYANANIDTLSPTAAGNFGIGGLGFVGYIGDGSEIKNFKLEEVFSAGAGEDIFAIDGLETLTVVPEPSSWLAMTVFSGAAVLLVRRRRANSLSRPSSLA